QFMAAYGALGIARARRLSKTADIACALSVEALQGSRTSFLPAIHSLRPLRGQQDSAANILRLLEGSAINESHRWCDQVQDAYSLRCAAQVHGASRDLLDYVEATIAVELNAATDNPLVLVDEGILVSNGNFHGQPLAFALDALARSRCSPPPRPSSSSHHSSRARVRGQLVRSSAPSRRVSKTTARCPATSRRLPRRFATGR